MKKPYFYPLNQQAPIASWILMSHNYKSFQNNMVIYGMIIVTQLKGTIDITLKAKPVCLKYCIDLSLTLFPGESLVFLSDLWIFSYQFTAEKDFSVTFITETEYF